MGRRQRAPGGPILKYRDSPGRNECHARMAEAARVCDQGADDLPDARPREVWLSVCDESGNLSVVPRSRSILWLLLLSALAAALVSAAAAPTASADTRPDATALKAYLSSAHWPIRTSWLRARFVSRSIDGWVTYGDPPFLGQIAAGCATLIEMGADPRGSPATVKVVPNALSRPDLRVARKFSESRLKCRQARKLAKLARASDTTQAQNQARHYFQEFAPTLRTFAQAVAAWRLAVLDYAPTVGVETPDWVIRLQ
jgi:hypothetical protein